MALIFIHTAPSSLTIVTTHFPDVQQATKLTHSMLATSMSNIFTTTNDESPHSVRDQEGPIRVLVQVCVQVLV